jgi:predicted RNA-binding Zn-ribbon protein involved in translation (DUF1610 family)
MKDKVMRWLKSLYQSANKELSERPIATTWVLISIAVVMLPLILSGLWRAFVLYQLTKLMKPQIALSLFPLSVSIFALLAIVLLACFLRIKKQDSKDFYFIPYDAFTWKVKIHGNRQYSVDPYPFCKLHQIKLVTTDNTSFVCPVCGSQSAIKIPQRRRSLLYEAVKNLAEAQLEDHIKRDN